MRGNRCRKVNSSSYQAFDSPAYPHLATLGVEIEWNERYLLQVEGVYRYVANCRHLQRDVRQSVQLTASVVLTGPGSS